MNREIFGSTQSPSRPLRNTSRSPSSTPKTSWADTVEYHSGTVAENHELVPEKDKGGTVQGVPKRKPITRNRTLAFALIQGRPK